MSLLTSTNTPNTAGEYYIPITGAVNPFPIPGPAGPQGAAGPQGVQGASGVNAYGSWYYEAGAPIPPSPQSMWWNGTDIYFSLVSIPPGTDIYLRALQTQFISTGAMTLYISTTGFGGAHVGFTASITAINFNEPLGYAQFTFTLVGPIPFPPAPGTLVNVFDGGGTVGPAGPPGPAGAAGTAATVAVGTTTTLAAGSPATVSNSGTPNAAILDFGIPQGATGPPGPAGPPDWSNYPAVSNVNAAGYNITNTGTLGSTNIDCYQSAITGFGTLQVGSPVLLAPNPGTINVNGTLTVQRGTANFYANALGVEFDGQSVVPAANSIKFGAIPVGGVNSCRLEMNTITSPAAITIASPAYITADAVGAVNMTAGGAALLSAGGTTTIESAAKDIRLQGTGGSYSDVKMFGGTLSGMGNLTGQAGTGVAIGNVGSIGGVGSTIPITTSLAGSAGINFATQGDVISNSAGSVPNSLNAIGALARFKDTTEFFVSANGAAVGADGSALNPFQTVQAAINAAEAISSAANICVINIASGHYTENLTFTKGYVMLNGVLSTQTANEITEITGSITISCAGAADLFNRQVVFQGLNITCGAGQSCVDNSTTSHSVAFQDCKIFSNGQFFNGISTGADARTYFTNCEISQTNVIITSPTIRVALGAVEIERVDITTDGNASCIEIAGTASLQRLSLSTLENTNTSSTVAPILLFTTTSLAVQAIGQTTFTYTSSTSRAASPNSSAIRIATGVNTTLILLNNYYTMNGLIGSANNVITYNGVGSPALLMNENRSLYIPTVAPNTYSIQAGISKVNYTDINGPAAGSYSSSATQPAAAAGAATTLTFNTTEKQFNTSLVAGSRIYTAATGTFRFDYSIQMDNASGGSQNANIWIAKNGTAVPRSASTITLASNAKQLPFVSYTLDLNAGDYLEVIFNATDPNVRALAAAAAAPVPAIPSIIVNLTQVGS